MVTKTAIHSHWYSQQYKKNGTLGCAMGLRKESIVECGKGQKKVQTVSPRKMSTVGFLLFQI